MCALVTGVQTCALPIFWLSSTSTLVSRARLRVTSPLAASDTLASMLLTSWYKASFTVPPSEICGRMRKVRPTSSRDIVWKGLLAPIDVFRSEEHTSELQSLMRISYAVFCLKTKNIAVHIDVIIVIRSINAHRTHNAPT